VNQLFVEFAIILILGGIVAFFVSLLRQPSIIGYIITGLIVGPFGYYQMRQSDVFSALAQVGVTLLLFMVGMQLDISQLKKIGRVAVLTAVLQVGFAAVVMYALLKSLGFSTSACLYLAPAFTFASTIIVVKLLGEKKDLQSLYGKMVIGIHLTQDLIAILLLIFLTTLGTGGEPTIYTGLPLWQSLVMVIVRSLILLLVLWWVSLKVLPKIVRSIGHNDELMLVFSIAWALGLATFFALPFVGFSLEIGGFLAGLALGRSGVHYEISGKVKPIQDLFIMIFFILLGTHLLFYNLGGLIKPALIISAAVLIINPLIILIALGFFGYKPRTGFFTAMTVGQVSEFSLILVASGLALGRLQNRDVELATLVAMITIAISSYLIMYSAQVYEWLKGPLRFFDFKGGAAERHQHTVVLKNHIILVGVHRLGHYLVPELTRQSTPFVIVDFDPNVVEKYSQEGLFVICGDITDDFVQEQANMPAAKMVISTLPDFNDNISLLHSIHRHTARRRIKPKLIFSAQDETQTKILYENGVDYVISPHFMGGMHLAKILGGKDKSFGLQKLREGHLEILLGNSKN